MQQEGSHTFVGPLGLRTLMNRQHQLQRLRPERLLTVVPPVVQIDAIWLTQLRPNGRWRTDAQGRRRAVTGRFKRPLFIAFGVWPESQEALVLAWRLGESESVEEWLPFLTELEEAGLRGANGLQLIIHDGGSGLGAALDLVYFNAAQQRCLFHKLRNIAEAVKTAPELSAKQQARQRRAILNDFRLIWQPQQLSTALRRYRQLVRHYRASQPEAVATLRRDFRDTLTFFALEKQQPDWPRRYLRTTSWLERFNEYLRARSKTARAYHSDTGILAMVAQVADRFNQHSLVRNGT
jgi:transposase-like protein